MVEGFEFPIKLIRPNEVGSAVPVMILNWEVLWHWFSVECNSCISSGMTQQSKQNVCCCVDKQLVLYSWNSLACNTVLDSKSVKRL